MSSRSSIVELKIEEKESFEYLGTTITENGIDDINVTEKIKAAEKAMLTLLSTGFFGHRLMPIETRVDLVKSYVISKLTSALNTFIITGKNEEKIRNFGNDVMRKVFNFHSIHSCT